MNKNKMKLSVIIVIILFFGSSLGLGILMLPSSKNKKTLPKKILLNEITKGEEEQIIRIGGTIIYFYHSTSCEYCSTLKEKMIEVASLLKPYVYIVYKESNTTRIFIKNAYLSKEIGSGGLRDLLSYACTTIPPDTPQHDRCVDMAITSDNRALINNSTNKTNLY